MKKNLTLFLSFFIPVTVFLSVFALYRVSPFGKNTLLYYDMGGQYYPFLSDYLQKIKGGHSLFWSWTQGGVDFLAVIAYYLASPLNFLLLLAPESVLPEAAVFLIVFKIGLAGLFMGIFLLDCFAAKLRRTSAPELAYNDGFTVSLFAMFYALSSFVVTRYWNIMWLDAFALLPLVILGETALIREGKFKLYIITLSLSIITNFYMGFYTCVFVGITFFAQSFIQKLTFKEFLRKFFLIAAYSVIAIGISAFLTVPAYTYLTTMGPTSKYGFPGSVAFFNDYKDVLGGLLAFSQSTTAYSLPNLYCGMLCVLLIAPFLGSLGGSPNSPKIKHREKVAFVFVAAFMLLSCSINILDYIWNAFRFVYGLQYRYIYVFIFTVTAAAYRAFIIISSEGIKRYELLLIITTATVVLWAASMGAGAVNVLLNAIFCAGYILVFAVFGAAHNLKSKNRQAILKNAATIAIIVLALTETSLNAYKTIGTAGAEVRDGYFSNYAEIKALLNTTEPPPDDFYRTELTAPLKEHPAIQFNAPSIFGYNGLTFYSSTIAEDMSKFYDGIGLSANASAAYSYNSYGFSLSSPLSAMFLNLRYVISDSASSRDDIFWEVKSDTEGELALLENIKYLPLGFMAHNDILGYTVDKTNPFITQNNLFCAATGLSGSLFTLLSPAVSSETNLIYEMPKDSSLYIYCDNKTGVMIQAREFVNRFPYIIPAGYYNKGETVSLTADISRYFGQETTEPRALAAIINDELFNVGYDILADETLEITEFRDTYIHGEITALADGVLYTSIPLSYNWTAYVDGKKTEIEPVCGAMAGLKVSAGKHIIEFRYFNKPFVAGVVVSLISLGAFVVMWVRLK